jgi:hypothetical protein
MFADWSTHCNSCAKCFHDLTSVFQTFRPPRLINSIPNNTNCTVRKYFITSRIHTPQKNKNNYTCEGSGGRAKVLQPSSDLHKTTVHRSLRWPCAWEVGRSGLLARSAEDRAQNPSPPPRARTRRVFHLTRESQPASIQVQGARWFLFKLVIVRRAIKNTAALTTHFLSNWVVPSQMIWSSRGICLTMVDICLTMVA